MRIVVYRPQPWGEAGGLYAPHDQHNIPKEAGGLYALHTTVTYLRRQEGSMRLMYHTSRCLSDPLQKGQQLPGYESPDAPLRPVSLVGTDWEQGRLETPF